MEADPSRHDNLAVFTRGPFCWGSLIVGNSYMEAQIHMEFL